MKRRLVAVFSVLTAVLAVTVLLAFTVGSARFTLKEMFAALFNGGISFFSQLYPDVLASYASFSAGGFSDIYADDLIVPAIMIAGGVAVASVLSRRINLLVLATT